MKIALPICTFLVLFSLSACVPESNHFEIFTVYVKDGKDAKYSVLLDKKTGRMWDLGITMLTVAKTIPAPRYTWSPAVKFDTEESGNEWFSIEQEKLDSIGRPK